MWLGITVLKEYAPYLKGSHIPLVNFDQTLPENSGSMYGIAIRLEKSIITTYPHFKITLNIDGERLERKRNGKPNFSNAAYVNKLLELWDSGFGLRGLKVNINGHDPRVLSSLKDLPEKVSILVKNVGSMTTHSPLDPIEGSIYFNMKIFGDIQPHIHETLGGLFKHSKDSSGNTHYSFDKFDLKRYETFWKLLSDTKLPYSIKDIANIGWTIDLEYYDEDVKRVPELPSAENTRVRAGIPGYSSFELYAGRHTYLEMGSRMDDMIKERMAQDFVMYSSEHFTNEFDKLREIARKAEIECQSK